MSWPDDGGISTLKLHIFHAFCKLKITRFLFAEFVRQRHVEAAKK